MIALHTKGALGFKHFMSAAFAILLIIFSSCKYIKGQANGFPEKSANSSTNIVSSHQYLPIIQKTLTKLPIIYIPHHDTENYHEAAVTWFGEIKEHNNWSDIRIGYTDTMIYVRISSIDDYLWNDETPDIHNLTPWDGATIYLDLAGNNGNELNSEMYSFTQQLCSWPGEEPERRMAHQGSSSGWVDSSVPFSTWTGFQGGGVVNSGELAAGFLIGFEIPFSSLGYTPIDGASMGFAVTLHDRDSSDGSLFNEQYWPQAFDDEKSLTWGRITFGGLPAYAPPEVTNLQTITIKDGVNGIYAPDQVVGGNTDCASWYNNGGWGVIDPYDYWLYWGDHIYARPVWSMNVQNQGNIDDRICFSRFYITFPLDSLPINKSIVSATLTLIQSGQSTGFPSDPPEAEFSLVQISLIDQDWDESSLSWNNGPIPIENVSQTSVGNVLVKTPRVWDLSQAVAECYAEGKPLRLAIYSSDYYGPHGKYFFTRDMGVADRPTLEVVLGDPLK